MIPDFLRNVINDGKCIPIIGAGFSMNAELPSGQSMPDWNTLIQTLASEIPTDKTSALEIAQEYEKKFLRTGLLGALEKLLHKSTAKPSQIHREFVKIPSIDFVCTTNFDLLLEKTYEQENIPFEILMTREQIALHGSDTKVKILKMHGDFSNHSKIVFTENDYRDYVTNSQSIIAILNAQLLTKTPLYIGFSLTDPNFCQIKQIVEEMMKESIRKGFIVLFDPIEEEKQKYEKMNLIVVSLSTNNRTKREVLLEFLKEINQTLKSPTTISANLAVSVNKTILFYDQMLTIRTSSNPMITNVPLIRIIDEKGNTVYSDNMENGQRINDHVREIKIKISNPKWVSGKQYTVIAEQNGESSKDSFYISEPTNIVAQTDRSVYIYGSTMILTAIIPHAHMGSEISYEFLDKNKKKFYDGKMIVDSEDTGIYQEIIAIEGENWRKRGDEIEIILRYGKQEASVIVYASNFGATVELDQKVYTWTDKVYITIVAPDFSIKTDQLNTIGSDPEHPVIISTSKGTLNRYTLVETAIHSGIFVGEIKLSSFQGHELSNFGNRTFPMGITRGIGPEDGLIACIESDALSVSFKFSEEETVVSSALVRLNIGEIQWLEANYQVNDSGIIRVIDPDMNLNPDTIVSFKVTVWSDTDAKGLEIPVYETYENSGIFEGIVLFTDKISKNGMLRVSVGDTVTAVYRDSTLPNPYSINDSLSITATTRILTDMEKPLSPLERISIQKLILSDNNDRLIKFVNVNHTVKIGATLTNNQKINQKISFIAKIRIGDYEQFSTTYSTIKSKSSTDVTISWTPTKQGIHSIQFYVWEGIDNSIALAAPLDLEIDVV